MPTLHKFVYVVINILFVTVVVNVGIKPFGIILCMYSNIQ